MKKRVLVTGGAGYIGSHTTVELVEAGYDVVIVDNFSNSEPSSLSGITKILGQEIPFVEADCCDKKAMLNLFNTYKFDAVIHFAAYKAVGESISIPLEYYKNNIGSLITLLEVMKETEVNNIVFSSSCTVYGQADVLPVTEKTPRKDATSPYGNTKQMCEDVLQFTTNAYPKTKGIALRYFNPIGAHPTALIGELPKGTPNNLVPFITQTAAGIREQLSVFGNDYNTPDGSNLRDYIDVIDLAKAHVIAVSRLINNKNRANYEVFNIGTGRAVSVLELVEKFQSVNSVKLNYKIVGRRDGDIEAVWADTSHANNELGWVAERKVEDTLRCAWEWEKHVRGL